MPRAKKSHGLDDLYDDEALCNQGRGSFVPYWEMTCLNCQKIAEKRGFSLEEPHGITAIRHYVEPMGARRPVSAAEKVFYAAIGVALTVAFFIDEIRAFFAEAIFGI